MSKMHAVLCITQIFHWPKNKFKIIQMYLEVILYENPQTSYQGLYFGNLLEKSANQFSETYSQSRQGEYKYKSTGRTD